MKEYSISYGVGNTRVELAARYAGKDLVVMLTAGRAHVGAVALAVPCPRTAEGVTASCSVMTVPGHRDNIPAEKAALMLCKAYACPVSVTAGMHIDKASKEEIKLLVENTSKAIELLIEKMRDKENGF